MSFAAFILKLEADTKGVNAGVSSAINQFKKLGATIKEVEKRRVEEHKAAQERLKPEEKLVQLMRTREQIANRIARVEDPKLKLSYLQKQVEVERKLTDLKKQQADAAANEKRKGVVSQVAGFVAAGGVAGMGARAGINSAHDIETGALKANISPEAFQRLQNATAASGGDFGNVLNTFLDVQKNRSGALMGDKEQIKNFGRLGYSQADLTRMSPEELFFDLSNKVQTGQINDSNIAAFFKVAEQGAKEILPAMKRGLDDAASGMLGFVTTTSPAVRHLASIKTLFGEIGATAGGVGKWLLRGTTSGALGLGRLGAASLLNIPAMLGSGRAAAARDNILDKRADQFSDGGDIDLTANYAAARQRREILDAENREAAEEEAKREFIGHQEWMRQQRDNVKKSARRDNFGAVDTDELARIGLFRGGQAGQQKFQDDILREVRDIKQDIAQIRSESES